MFDMTENDRLIRFAHDLADCAGKMVLPHFRRKTEVISKSQQAFDPVTEADRGAEAAMRDLIAASFPQHGISGEEFGDKSADSPYRWLLDPIDGTKAFIAGLPAWGTLIGLTHEGLPVLGMMDQPYIQERFWGSRSGAFIRTRVATQPLSSRRCASLSHAILSATSPDMFKGDAAERFARLSSACRLTRFGGDCYLYCLLAMGFIDIVAEASLKPYDIVPLVPIIEAAGGVVTNWDGGSPLGGGEVLAAGDPSLHEAALAALASG